MASKKKSKKAQPTKKPAKKSTAKKIKKAVKPKVKAKVSAKAKSKVKPKAKIKVAVKNKTRPVVKASKKAVDYSQAITPLGDRLVVRVLANERVTAGGLIIPETVSEAVGFLKATVLAVGRGTQNKKGFIKTMDVQVGDAVLFSQHSGTKVKFNAEDLQIIHETDVMGIVQK